MITVMDFVGFTYNKLHSIRDLGIYRTGSKDGYDEKITPTLKTNTQQIPSLEGSVNLGTQVTQREFTINFAFDHLTEEGIRKIKQTFNGKEVGELIFDELPYKAYDAKVKSPVQLKFLCFDENFVDEKGANRIRKIYKGEGTIQFVCYQPFAHTVNWSWQISNGKVTEAALSTKHLGHYATQPTFKDYYTNHEEWKNGSGTESSPVAQALLINRGELDNFFVLNFSGRGNVGEETLCIIGEKEAEGENPTVVFGKITLDTSKSFVWNSKTGIIKNEEGQIINYKGNGIISIPPGFFCCIRVDTENESGITSEILLSGAKFDYEFWYH